VPQAFLLFYLGRFIFQSKTGLEPRDDRRTAKEERGVAVKRTNEPLASTAEIQTPGDDLLRGYLFANGQSPQVI
jgi:hypothetical protein